MSIMLFCPTWTVNGADQITPETVACMEHLAWDGELEVVIGRLNPYPINGKNKLENVLAQYRNAREIFLESDHEAMLTIEHDILAPPNALELLYAVDADVVYGVYVLRQAKTVLNTWRFTSGGGLGMSLTLFPPELEAAKREVTPLVSGIGFGCTLIRREPLEQIPMRRNDKGGHPSPDIPFSSDCITKGFIQRAHFGVLCGHIKPNGQVLWPFSDNGEVTSMERKKYFVTSGVNAQIAGVVTHFAEGSTITLPESHAHELVRAGYLREVKPKKKAPAKKTTATKRASKKKVS